MGGPANRTIVNSAGSSLSDYDRVALGKRTGMEEIAGVPSSFGLTQDQQAKMFLNWLTAGGAPKPTDPGQIFAEQQANAPAAQAAARGAGFGGLFGTGSMIGELAPAPEAIKPLNLSPLQPGVPYSVPAVPKVGGR